MSGPEGVRLLPFRPEHMATFPDPVPGPITAPWIGKAVSVVENGRTLGVFGLYSIDNGKVGVAALISDKLRRRPLVLHRRCARGLQALRREMTGYEVWADVRESDVIAQRWVERLGFHEVWRSQKEITYVKEL